MAATQFYDLSDVMETFDLEESKRLLESQLESLHTDICDSMPDNFKILYQRYTSIQENTGMQDPDIMETVKDAFYNICLIFIKTIGEEFDFDVDECFLDDHHEELPSIALQFYLFFVLNLRSNLYDVLIHFISAHLDELATQFDEMKQRKDSITEINRRMEDQRVGLIASNIYDVVDWVLENIDEDTFFQYMEPDYIALPPVKDMFERGDMTGNFMVPLRDLLKENIFMKGRICFDIICKLKGYDMT